jgi:hypothetical protein
VQIFNANYSRVLRKRGREATEACLEKTEAMMNACQEPGRSEIKTGLEEMKATDLEVSTEEIEAVAELQEVPSEKAAVETVGALKDRSGDQLPTVGYLNLLRRQTKDDVRGTPKGGTFEKRRRTQSKFDNGIRDQDRKEQLCL